MGPCLRCGGGTLSGPCICPGGVIYGIGQPSAQAFGSSPASQYFGAGAGGFANPAALAQYISSLAQLSAIKIALPSPREPLESAGVTVGELVGWRVWRLRNGFLQSFSASYCWFPGYPVHGSPDDYGEGGIWAFKEPHHALYKLNKMGDESVMGSVWLWGDVVEHDIGYRAEFAEIRSIDVVSGAQLRRWWQRKRKRTLDVLRERYTVHSAFTLKSES